METIGDAYKTESHIEVFLPKSELKGVGVVQVGNWVTLLGSVILVIDLDNSIGATALAVL